MKKLAKIISLISVGLIAIVLMVAAFLSENVPVQAQGSVSGPLLICDEPIPIGEAIEESLNLMDDTYDQLIAARSSLKVALSELRGTVTALSEHPNTVCDFSACEPKVIDKMSDASLNINWIFGTSELLNAHFPWCVPKECMGNPCPDFEERSETIEGEKNAIAASYEIIKEIYNTHAVRITREIQKQDEALGDFIRRPEFVERKLTLARLWLKPLASVSQGIQRNCALTPRERELAAEGEMANVYPVRCVDALREGLYWPKAWSENCISECSEGPTYECKNCLGDYMSPRELANSSPLAKINYKIYGENYVSCYKEITPECINQICRGMSENECAAWLCGGSEYNYACCREPTSGY